MNVETVTLTRSETATGRPSVVAVTAAALLAGCGVVHLVMVPSHVEASTAEGFGFAIAGWAQLLLAAALVVRVRSWVWTAVAVSSVVSIGIWAVSRTVGLPVGAHAGEAESVGLVDRSVVGMQAVATVLAIAALLPRRRSTNDHVKSPSMAALIVVPLLVMSYTSTVLASPSARGHARSHGGEAAASSAHGHGAAPTDASNATQAAPAAHDHGAPDVAAPPIAGGEVASVPADDGGFSLVMNGHQHTAPVDPLTVEQTVALTQQLAATQELVVRYPTVADAELGGYHRYGPFGAAVGAHYGKGAETIVGPVIDETNAGKPMLIYDGTDPTSRLAGFMYIYPSVDQVPEGFAGAKDVWHSHTNICLVVYPDGRVDAPLGADTENVDPALCASLGGQILENSGYMLHVWNVPGYENPLGMFYATHPALTCADDSYHMKPMEDIGFSLSACADAP